MQQVHRQRPPQMHALAAALRCRDLESAVRPATALSACVQLRNRALNEQHKPCAAIDHSQVLHGQ